MSLHVTISAIIANMGMPTPSRKLAAAELYTSKGVAAAPRSGNVKKVALVAAIVTTASLIACASPAPSERGTAAAPPVLVPAASTPTNHVAVTIAVKSVGAPVNDPTFQVPFGYKRVILTDGQERFCRFDFITGSRTERQKVCYTEKQLKDHQNSTESFIDQIQKHGVDATALCTPGAGNRPCPSSQGY